MTLDESDGWMASMVDLQADTTKRAVAECNRLRRLVRELEAQIAATPATVWELQERVTQLETLLSHTRGVNTPDGGQRS